MKNEILVAGLTGILFAGSPGSGGKLFAAAPSMGNNSAALQQDRHDRSFGNLTLGGSYS